MQARSTRYDINVSAGVAQTSCRVELVTPDDRVMFVMEPVSGSASDSKGSGTITSQLTVTLVDRTDELGVEETTTIRSAIYGKLGDTYGSGMGGRYGIFSTTIQSGVLMPKGSEVVVHLGFVFRDGTTERVLAGRFQLGDIAWDGRDTIQVTCPDRSNLISRNTWGFDPLTISQNTNYTDAIETVIRNRLNAAWSPRIATTLDSTAYLTPKIDQGTSPGGDPWSDICNMARVIGKHIYFDRTGNIRMEVAPNPATTEPAWTIASGEGGTLVSCDYKVQESQTYNGVVVTGSNATTEDPVRGEAYDDLPDSPYNINGDFGRKPLNISTPLVTDSGMAQNLANLLFVELFGYYEELEVSFLPQHALEVTDIVRVLYPELGIDHHYAIASLTRPLTCTGLMTATLRRRKESGEY